jgi:hypothetical protein
VERGAVCATMLPFVKEGRCDTGARNVGRAPSPAIRLIRQFVSVQAPGHQDPIGVFNSTGKSCTTESAPRLPLLQGCRSFSILFPYPNARRRPEVAQVVEFIGG